MMARGDLALRLVLGTALGASLAACGEEPCDPDAPNTICTIAGSGERGLNGDNGPATSAALYVPQDTAVSPDGEVWLLDFNNYLVRAIDANGIIRTVVGNGELGDSPAPGEAECPASEAYFNHTSDLFFHDGYLYLAAWHNSRIKRVRLSDMKMSNYAGIGSREYYSGDGGPALAAALDLPSSIALHPSGGIAIMDQANQVVRLIDAAGNIDRIAGTCIVDKDVPCTANEQPRSCKDSTTFPTSDKFACGDLDIECAKPCTPGFSGDGGLALEARMAQPFGQPADPAGRLTYDNAGNLLFADSENNRIRKVDTAGMITTIAGTGSAGYSGDGGPAELAQINRPIDIEVGPDNTIYFTDVNNSCVRKIDPSGIISRVVGRCSPNPDDRGFSGDGGPPLDARLDRPYGIDLHGNKLYVTDSYNDRIRVVNLP